MQQMTQVSVLRPTYIQYFRDYTRFRSGFWATALVASILVHAFVVWQTSRYVPKPPRDEVRVDVRMIVLAPPPPPPPPPPQKIVEPPPPPPPPKPVPRPPKEVPRQAPLPVVAAPPAPAAPAERVVPVQPPPAPLPPIDAPPPPPAPPAPAPPPAPVVAAPAEDVNALINGYGREVSRAFETAKRYPRVAQMRSIQGQLSVRFEFSDGALVSVTLVDSSGQKLLDDAALETARKLNLPALGGTLSRRNFSFILPVEYRLQ